MIATFLAVALTPAFTFEGGGQVKLINAIGAYAQVPVIACVTEKKVDPFTLEWPKDSKGNELDHDAGLEEWVRQLAVKVHADTGLAVSSVKKGEIILRPKALPWYRFPNLDRRTIITEFPEDASLLAVKDGTATCRSDAGKYYYPTYLSFCGFSKPSNCHRFLATSAVVFTDFTMSEQKLLEAVASAVGGSLQEGKDKNFIDVDLGVFREQYVQWYKDRSASATSKLARMKADFQAEAVQIAPEKVMRKMVENENSLFDFELPPNSKASSLAMAYIKEYLQLAADNDKPVPGVQKQIAQIVGKQGNFSRPLRASFTSLGTVDVGVMLGTRNVAVDF